MGVQQHLDAPIGPDRSRSCAASASAERNSSSHYRPRIRVYSTLLVESTVDECPLW